MCLYYVCTYVYVHGKVYDDTLRHIPALQYWYWVILFFSFFKGPRGLTGARGIMGTDGSNGSDVSNLRVSVLHILSLVWCETVLEYWNVCVCYDFILTLLLHT